MKALIERTDSYIKHYFTLLVTWFTFFVTVNWASLGWLAANIDKSKDNKLIGIVSAVFAWQNFLAIIICAVMGVYFYIASKRLLKLESKIQEYKEYKNTFPLLFVLSAVAGMIVVIIPLGGVWVYIWLYGIKT